MTNKYEKIAKQLSKDITSGKIPVGNKLPSVLKISRNFSVSSVTAHRAVKELEKMDLVECRKGVSGTVVINRATNENKSQVECVACLLRPFTPDYERYGKDYFGPSLLIASIQKSIATAGGNFIYQSLSEPNFEDKMLELCRKPWVSGIIIDGDAPPDLTAKLADSGKPTVLFGRRQIKNSLSVIIADIESMCRETVAFLTSRKYKTLFFYAKADSMSWISEGVRLGIEFLEKSMAEAANNAGMEFVGLDFKLEKNMLKKNSKKRLAFLAISSGLAETLMKTFNLSPDNLGNGLGMIYCFPPCPDKKISHWKYRDIVAFGDIIVRELLARIKDPDSPPVITKVPLNFVDNASA